MIGQRRCHLPLDEFDRKEIKDLIAADKADILSAFNGLDVAQLEQLGQDIEGFLYGRQAALRKPKNTYTPRWTLAGSDVNFDNAATPLGQGHAGPTLPRWIDLVSGTAYLDASDPQMLHIATAGGADCMFNYLVSSCWTGTEGTSFTTSSGCTYKMFSKLFGTGYALADAQATGGTLEIYICGSETITSAHSLDTWKASTDTNIIIEGPGGIGLKNRRVTLTATNCHLLQGMSQATGLTLGASSVLFKNVDITVTGAFGVTALDADVAPRPLKFWFEHVNFSVTSGYLYTNVRGRPSLDYELEYCTGTINQFYKYANGGAQTGFGDLTLRQSTLTVATLFDQGSTKIIPNFFFYDTDLTITAANSWTQTAGSDPQWYFDGLFVTYTGGNTTTCLSGQVGSFSALGTTRIDFRDVTFFTGYTNVKFVNFTASAAGDSSSLIKFGNVRGFSSAGQAVTFITVDTGLTRTEAGVILANQWSTVYSGVTGSGPLISGVIVQDDDVTVDANAQTLDFGSGLQVTSSPAGEANIDLGPLTALYDQSGAFNWVNRGGDLLIANSKSLKIYSDNSTTPSSLTGQWLGSTGHLSLGSAAATPPAGQTLTISDSVGSGNLRGLNLALTSTTASSNAAQRVTGLLFGVTLNAGSGTQANAHGIYGSITQSGAAAVTNLDSLFLTSVISSVSAGAITTFSAVRIGVAGWSGPIPTTTYLLNGSDQGNASVVTAYGLYVPAQTGVASRSYIGDPLVVGGADRAKTAALDLAGDIRLDGVAASGTPAADDIVVYNQTGTKLLKAKDESANVYNLTHQHLLPAQVDVSVASTTVPYQVVGPMPQAGVITAVYAKLGENKTNGATSSIFDIHLITAANQDTDGQGTTVYTTQGNRPTISNTHMATTATAPDVTSFAAGDWFAVYTDQAGTSATVATVSIALRYT